MQKDVGIPGAWGKSWLVLFQKTDLSRTVMTSFVVDYNIVIVEVRELGL